MQHRIKRALTLIGDVFSGDAKRQYEAKYQIYSTVARRCGMPFYGEHLRWPSDVEFASVWKRFKYFQPAKDRQYQIYQLAKSVAHLNGHTVECGVFRGAGSYLILNATQAGDLPNNVHRVHHVFDSFEGLSQPEIQDSPSGNSAYVWTKGDLGMDERHVREGLTEFSRVQYFKGWIPTRFNEVADRRFCFVHIDVDLYQPTRDSISFFYERTVPGGIILCDDYGFETCPGAYQAMEEFFSDKPESVVALTSGQGVVFKL